MMKLRNLVLLVSGVSAQTVDFVSHNGFEECWPQSLTIPQYAALAPSFEGVPGCIPETGRGTATHFCYATTCADGQIGCPVTFRGGTSPFLTQAVRFDATHGIDPFSAVFRSSGAECTANFIDTSTLRYQYQVSLRSVLDGNDGRYVWDLALQNLNTSGLQSDDVTVTGSFICQATVPQQLFSSILAAAAPALERVFRNAPLLDRTVCPYPPPQ